MSQEPHVALDNSVAEQSEVEPDPSLQEATTVNQTQPETLTDPPFQEPNEHELLAEQFDNYLRIAKSLMKTLNRPKDIDICTDLMRKVERLNQSKHLEVKRNNNRFFRYCLKILNWTSTHQPMEYYQHWYTRSTDTSREPITESHRWLEDKKSYVASKSLKDGTRIIYIAVSSDPGADWQERGLNILAKRGSCTQN